jgi:hypothetical protein
MRRRLFLLVSAFSLLALSCSHTFGLNRQLQGRRPPASAVVYVALPESGRFEAHAYPDSGRQTGEEVVRAFAPHVSRATLGDRVESADEARLTAREEGATHLVVPTILHWEERATEWSGRPDRIRVLLQVYEVESGKLIDSAEVSGKSRWATFGGDHPQELLPTAVGDYVNTLFGAPAA